MPRVPPATTHRRATLLLLAAAGAVAGAFASDHSDAPQANGLLRQDANLTDLHAFVVGQNLVLALSTNPAIPRSAGSYVFPSDVTFEIHVDNHTEVLADDPYGMGGTILEPEKIKEDVTFRIRFGKSGRPRLEIHAHGKAALVAPSLKQPGPIDDAIPAGPGGKRASSNVKFFWGLRDDPFIRGPRQGRNVGSLVLELPLSAVATRQSALLIWATSKVADFAGPFQDLAGRSLRSMMPENAAMDGMHPRQQQRRLGVPPDVMIFDTSLPAAFPNGRALADDVVDLVGDPRLLTTDAPFPTDNDVPFLPDFPYLAPPQPPQ